MPNAVATDERIPVIFWRMATESLGDAACICKQLLGCVFLCVQTCCWWDGPRGDGLQHSGSAAVGLLQNKVKSYKSGGICIMPSRTLGAGKGTQSFSGTYQQGVSDRKNLPWGKIAAFSPDYMDFTCQSKL